MSQVETDRWKTLETAPVFGEISADEAAAAIYAGVPATHRDSISGNIERAGCQYYTWNGGIPGRRGCGPNEGAVGHYWVPNPYLAARVHDLASKPKKGETTPRGLRSVISTRAGLSAKDIGLICTLYAERDEGTTQEQLDNLARFEERTGLRWTVLALSGDVRDASAQAAGVPKHLVNKGKSVHAFMSINPTDIETFAAIQRLLIILLRSDPSITETCRLMRVPGVVGRRFNDRDKTGAARIQTCIKADHTATYNAQEVLERLLVVANEDGITSPDIAFAALQYASELMKLAGNMPPESAAAHRAAAQRILAARAVTEEILADLNDLQVTLTGTGLKAAGGHRTANGGAGRVTAAKARAGMKRGVGAQREYLPLATPIYGVDGVTYSIDDDRLPEEGVRCYDPILEHPGGSTPSGRLWKGRLFSQAGGVNRTYYPGCPATSQTVKAAPPGAAQQASWVLPPVPSAADAPCLLIATPMCSRKTTQIAALVADMKARSKGKILIITPTVALSSEAAVKFNARLYSDVDGDIHISEPYVICGPSIRRIAMGDILVDDNFARVSIPQLDMIVIEEIEQTMNILHSGTIMRHEGVDTRGAVFSKLLALCKACVAGGGQVMALDAHASDRAVNDLKRLTGLEPTILTAPEGAQTVWTGLVEERHPEIEGLIGAILKVADDPTQRGIIYANSQQDVLALKLILEKRHRSVIAIHASATAADRATLMDVNTEWEKADFVVYNDAAGSGVSFDGTGRHVFALVRHWPGYTWANPMQGVGRCRKPMTMSSWVSDLALGWNTDRKHIIEQAWKTRNSSIALAYSTSSIGGVPQVALRDMEYFMSMTDNIWVGRTRGARMAMGYYHTRVNTYGVALVDCPSIEDTPEQKLIGTLFKEARDAVKDKVVKDAIDAEEISDAEASELLAEAHLDEEDRARLHRHITLDRWGAVDEDLIRDTAVGRSKLHHAAREFGIAALAVRDNEQRLGELERHAVETKTQGGGVVRFTAQSSATGLRARLLVKLLAQAGIDVNDLVSGLPVVERAAPPTRFSWPPAASSSGPPEEEGELDADDDGIVVSTRSPQTLYVSPGPCGYTPRYSNASLTVRGWVDYVKRKALAVDFSILGLPTLPRDFDEAPATYLGKLLASIGIKTASERVAAGVYDAQGGVLTPNHEALASAQLASEAAWRVEKRSAKKANMAPSALLTPPARESWHTIDHAHLARWWALCARTNARIQGGEVISADALAAQKEDIRDRLLMASIALDILDEAA